MPNYNGWTNYATWRVNLEIFDGVDPRDMGWNRLDRYDLGLALKDYAEELICGYSGSKNTIAEDYALAFISDVNWREIADHMVENYPVEEETDELEDA